MAKTIAELEADLTAARAELERILGMTVAALEKKISQGESEVCGKPDCGFCNDGRD